MTSRAGDGLHDVGVGVADDQRAEGQAVVGQDVTIHRLQPGRVAFAHIDGVAAHGTEGADGTVHAARHGGFGTVLQGRTHAA